MATKSYFINYIYCLIFLNKFLIKSFLINWQKQFQNFVCFREHASNPKPPLFQPFQIHSSKQTSTQHFKTWMKLVQTRTTHAPTLTSPLRHKSLSPSHPPNCRFRVTSIQEKTNTTLDNRTANGLEHNSGGSVTSRISRVCGVCVCAFITDGSDIASFFTPMWEKTAMTKRDSRKDEDLDPNLMNLSLNGCGYLGIYHVGVCSCIKKYYPQALKGAISGGSVGALVACAFMCDVPLGECCCKKILNASFHPDHSS